MRTTTASFDFRCAAELVLEGLEIAGARGLVDLRMQARPFADTLSDLDARLADPDAPPLDEAAILAGLVAEPLRGIVRQPNYRLQRMRRKMAFQRVREQDSRCMAWFTRQPGRTVMEKLGRSQRLLGVVRELSPDVLENRVTHTVCERLAPVLQHYLDEHGNKRPNQRLTTVRRARHWAEQWKIIATDAGVRRIGELPHPNNALLRDASYHRIWLAAQRIALEDERLRGAIATIERGRTELFALLLALAVTDCGWPLLDTGLRVHDHPHLNGGRIPDRLADWSYKDRDRLVRLSLHIVGDTELELSQRVWLSNGETDRKKLRIVCEADAGGAGFMLRLRDAPPQNYQISAHWSGLQAAREFLDEMLSGWGGPTRTGLSSLTANNYPACLIQFSRSEIIVNDRGTPLFVGKVRVPGTDERILILGAAAQRLTIHTHPGRCALGWILPGRFLRTLLPHSNRRQALSGLLRAVAGSASDGRDLVCAIPAALPFGAERAISASLPREARRTFLVPHTVAMALDWIGAGDSGLESQLVAESYYAFLALDGEQPDFSVMQWTFGPEVADRNGWLRFAAESDRQPAIEPWSAVAFKAACSRLGLSVSTRERVSALLQIADTDLVDLAADRRSDLAVWIRPETDGPMRVLIERGDVLEAIENWGRAVSEAAGRQLDAWRAAKMPEPLSLLVAGTVTEIETFRNAWGDFPTKILWRNGGAVTSGLKTFLSRFEKKLPTWRDYLPKLELLVGDAKGHQAWQVLFDEKSTPQAGVGELFGREYEFELAAGKLHFALPLRRDDQRSKADPVLQLTEALPQPAKVQVRAAYRTGGGGLIIRFKSVQPGLVPETEMEWSAAGEAAAEPQAFAGKSTPLSPNRIADEAAKLREALDAFFGDERNLKSLDRTVRDLIKFLKLDVSVTESDVWIETTAEDVGALCSRLLYLKELNVDMTSEAFPQSIRGGAFRPPHGGIVKSRRLRLAQDTQLQFGVLRALSHLRSAAPFVFADWCLKRIDKSDLGNEERIACVRAMGIVAAARGSDGGLIERILVETEQANKSSDMSMVPTWFQALGLFLNSRKSAVNLVSLPRLAACAYALCHFVETSTSGDPVKPTIWRHLLFALLSVRHGTRLEDGMGMLGPRSELAKHVEATLHESSRRLIESGRSKEVEGIRFFEHQVGRSEVWRGKNALEQVAEVWRGKVVALLKQGGGDDE